MARIEAYLSVARAPFLLLPLTLIAVGSMVARLEAPLSWGHALLAGIGLIALHMAVNIFNEISDMNSGIDLETHRTPFSGGSGTLPEGRMSQSAAKIFAIVCSLLGLGVGLYFLRFVGTPMLILMICGAILVLGYTNILARIGIGEIGAGLGLGGLPVIGAALVQTGSISRSVLAASIPATLMTFNLLLMNEFPDEEADRRGGRKNIILLSGRRAAARIYLLAAVLTPLSILGAVILHFLPPVTLLAMAPTLILIPHLIALLRDPNQALPLASMAANVRWNLATNIFLALALFVEKIPW